MTRINISFTGQSKKLTAKEKAIVKKTIEGIQGNPTLFHSGAARGVDTWAAECAIRAFPEAKHVVLIPQWRPKSQAPPQPCDFDRKGMRKIATLAAELGVYMQWHWACAGVPDERTGFMVRNDALALNCTHMLAFPRTGIEQQRSGTWATIRRAQKNLRPVLITPLNGNKPSVLRPRQA